MNLRSVKYFCETVESGSIAGAAERLYVASTAISMQIAQLESQLGGQLFNRSYRPMKLTSLGHFYYPRAKKLLLAFEELEGETKGVADGKKGWLGIGFVRSTLFDLLPRTIRSFQEKFPAVRLSLVELLSEYQPPQLRDGIIQLGISRFLGPYDKSSDLKYDLLFEEPFVAVLPREHHLAESRSIRVSDLASIPFISYPKDPYSPFSKSLIAILQSAGGNPLVNYEANEIHTALALVSANLGATIVGRSVSVRNYNDVVFIPIEDLHAKSQIVVISKDDYNVTFIESFIDFLKESVFESGLDRG